MPDVTVAVLGELELRVGGRVVAITRPRLRALVCALALRAGRVVPLDSLAAQVWGERPPDRFRPGLHTLVNQLRTLAGADLVRTTPGGYLLDLPPDAVDALRFQRLLDSVAGVSAAEERPVLVEALALWRGDNLAGHELAAYLVERYLSAVERRIDLDLELGRPGTLVAELRGLTIRFPLRESLWARLMRAQYLSGRHAEALETYQTVRTLLADALGTSPSAELRDLHKAVLSSDDDRPVTPVRPRQLPAGTAVFAGRQAELTALDGLLDTDEAPLIVAMHGPAGAGKTALALRWAHRVSGRFPDGNLYLDLRGYGPGAPLGPAAALRILLGGLGVPADRIPPTAEEAAALWRTLLFDRRMLVLLDNARDASAVRALLPGTGTVLVVVTSRAELTGLATRDGAHRLAVGALPHAEAVTLARRFVAHEADELVELCDRLPLALVIAATRAATNPDFLAELRDSSTRLDLLADPDDPAMALRTQLSWSYQALDAGPARALRILGFHFGHEFSLTTAATVLGEPLEPTRRRLDAIASVHLVERTGPGRFRFPELVRLYAAELARSELVCLGGVQSQTAS